jgi:hypothetical protein
MYEVTVKIKGNAESFEQAINYCRLKLEITANIRPENIEIIEVKKVLP